VAPVLALHRTPEHQAKVRAAAVLLPLPLARVPPQEVELSPTRPAEAFGMNVVPDAWVVWPASRTSSLAPAMR
jgi:hypothetical protein